MILRSGFKLKTDAHLDMAMMNNVTVVAYQAGEALTHGGVIQAHNDFCVTIDDYHYVKQNCEFKVR